MAPPDEKPPINPVPGPQTQRERLEREQAEMRERRKAPYPLADEARGRMDRQTLFLVGACIIAGAVMLGAVVYYFVF